MAEVKMEEDGHKIYGGDTPDVLETEGGVEVHGDGKDVDISADDAPKELELDEFKQRLKEIEEESAALSKMQDKVAAEMGSGSGSLSFQDAESLAASKAEIDSRSVFVGNVAYALTPELVQLHFKSCGTVNRVTIPTDNAKLPMGFAYVEFHEIEAVKKALKLNDSELLGRRLKVSPKRTNVPGKKDYRPRRALFRRPNVPYEYGKFPGYPRGTRYMPYGA